MLRPYRELARVPRALALLTWTLVGRLHQTGTPLAMSFLIAGWTGSYARAGVVAALLMAGMGVAGPVLGRLADKRGAAGQLMVSGVIYGLGLTLVAYLPSWVPAGWWPVEGVLAFTVGLSCPQVAPIARATWPRMLSGTALTSMYTVEATFTELLYAVGPLLAASVVAVLNPALAIVTCGALATLGSVVFARALTTAGYGGPLPASTRATSSTGLLRAPGVLASLGLVVCLVGALFTVDTTIVALARNMDLPILAGALGAVWAVGSFGGGMIAGGLSGQPRLAFRVLLTLVGLAALIPVLPPLVDPASPWLVGAVLLLGGAAISPAVAAANIVLGELAPADRRAEAFGWASTASTAGFFIALPGSGLLLDHGGPAFAATGATAIGILAVLLTLLIPAPKPAPTPATASAPAHS